MDMITTLLAQKERAGLKQLFVAGLVMSGAALVLNVFFLPDTPLRTWRIASWSVPIAGSLVALWMLRNEGNNLFAGLLFTLLATGYLAFSAYTNSLVVHPNAFSPSTMVLLTDTAGMSLVIAATALTLRPVYPLITAVSVVSMYATFLFLAFNDPSTLVAANYTDFLTQPAILPTNEASIVVFPLLIGLFVAVAVRNARQVTRRAVELEVQNRDLSRYFSPNVVSRITSGGVDATTIGGKRQHVVVLFSDMEGFTSLSANMQPEEALTLLSDYQEHMVGAIFANQGTLDKFIGDGIMATFGTPDPQPYAALNAVHCAQAMEEELRQFNEGRLTAGLQPIRHRIGIHAGPALVGNVGTAKRLEFTVIGDSVNVASRVERACKDRGESLLVSESVQREVAENFGWRPVGEISVAGHEESVKLFAPKISA